MAKITQKALEAIKADQDGQVVRDEGNLFGNIRVKTNGTIAISFYYRFRFDGKHRDFSCGTWPTDSLAKIRANRDAAKTKVARGIDPLAEKKLLKHEANSGIEKKLTEIKQLQADSLTLQDMFDGWLKDGVRRQDGNAELMRSFKADVLGKIGVAQIKLLTEHELRAVLRDMVSRGVNRAAVIMFNDLRQMFAWAEKRQPWRKLLLEGNPMELIEIEKLVSANYDMNNRCERVLLPEEIQELRDIFKKMRADYAAAPNKRIVSQPIEIKTELAVWIMLSTICRVGELSMARWEHVDLVAGEWFIPKENVKDNVADQTVYLSSFTLAQFQHLHRITGHTDWCFPGRNQDIHICPKTKTKQIGDRQAMFKESGAGNVTSMAKRKLDNSLVLGGGKNGSWTPHDLRRTGATMMQALGVKLDTIDRCQNHVLEGSKVRRHYLHYEYAEEKRAAWFALGERLNQLLG